MVCLNPLTTSAAQLVLLNNKLTGLITRWKNKESLKKKTNAAVVLLVSCFYSHVLLGLCAHLWALPAILWDFISFPFYHFLVHLSSLLPYVRHAPCSPHFLSNFLVLRAPVCLLFCVFIVCLNVPVPTLALSTICACLPLALTLVLFLPFVHVNGLHISSCMYLGGSRPGSNLLQVYPHHQEALVKNQAGD